MQKEIIIRIDNDFVYLGAKLAIPTSKTNFPLEHCRFTTAREIYWKVELLEYFPEKQCWSMRVIDYNRADTSDFFRQSTTRPVTSITFDRFDWHRLERLLSWHQKSHMDHILYNHDKIRFGTTEADHRKASNARREQVAMDMANAVLPLKREALPRIIKTEFSVAFSDATFAHQRVTFSKKPKEVGQKLDFFIRNEYLRPEFESIKTWFPKRLKTKKFRVVADITMLDNNVQNITASSSQIELINQELIDSIKEMRTITLTKSPSSRIQKSLFSADEIFSVISSEKDGNVFDQDESNIMRILLKRTRNKKQLEYLSSERQSDSHKLRFTLHPDFGFVFFVEGRTMYHFVWELLNSNATYIWSSDKNIEVHSLYKKIEHIIGEIRMGGRELYRRDKKEQQDFDLPFTAIGHDEINSESSEGFSKWKQKLEQNLL